MDGGGQQASVIEYGKERLNESSRDLPRFTIAVWAGRKVDRCDLVRRADVAARVAASLQRF